MGELQRLRELNQARFFLLFCLSLSRSHFLISEPTDLVEEAPALD